MKSKVKAKKPRVKKALGNKKYYAEGYESFSDVDQNYELPDDIKLRLQSYKKDH